MTHLKSSTQALLTYIPILHNCKIHTANNKRMKQKTSFTC